MSDDSERVIVTKQSRVYHTNPDCERIRGFTTEWDRDEAEQWGKTHCKHCVGTPRGEYSGEQIASKLRKADPEDVGLPPTGERQGGGV